MDEKTFITSISTVIAIVILAVISALIISAITSTDLLDCTNNTASNSSNITVESTSTLYPVGDGITSSEVKANNRTFLDFDGTDDLINLINFTEFVESGNYTVSFLFKSNLNKTGTLFESTNGANERFGIQFFDDKTIRCGQYNGSWSAASSPALDLNRWYYVTCSYLSSPRTTSLYIDGVFISNTGQSPGTGGDKNTFIGSRSDLNVDNYFNGSVNSFKVFDSNLESFEIYQSYIDSCGIKISSDDININELPEYYKSIYLKNSTLAYAWNGTDIVKSADSFSSIVPIYQTTNTVRNIFVDSRGTVFAGEELTNGNLTLSFGNDTNWTMISPFICDGTFPVDSGAMWYITEDDIGDLYMGEYTIGNGDTNCSYIHKSTDGGLTWDISYNSTAEGWGARHMHIVKFNEYNKCLYAAQGDDFKSAGQARLIRSCDYGNTWQSIQNDPISQYITIEFTSDYRIFGSDTSPNGIYRTNDDINFDIVFNFTKYDDWDAYPWSMSKDNIGNIYFGTRTVSSGYSLIGIYMSSDDGDSWKKVTEINASANKGYQTMSNFDEEGFAYTYEDQTNTSYKFNASSLLGDVFFNLNENNGTIAYDSSGNSNNGIINGATWFTDGILVTLVAITDYTLNPTTGLFTIVNNDYSWSQLLTSWTYVSSESCPAGVNPSEIADDFGEFITGLLGFLGIMGVILGVLWLITYVNKLFSKGGLNGLGQAA